MRKGRISDLIFNPLFRQNIVNGNIFQFKTRKFYGCVETSNYDLLITKQNTFPILAYTIFILPVL